MHLTQTQLLRSLAMFCVMCSDSTGVRVRLENTRTASTDTEVVTIPNFAVQSERDLDKAFGYAEHECGHVKHTNIHVFRDFSQDDVRHSILNVIEDIWTELAMEKTLPGIRDSFNRLDEILLEDDLAKGQIALNLFNHMENTCRYKVKKNPALQEQFEKSKEAMANQYGEAFIDVLDSLLLQSRECSSTAQAVELATEVHELLENEFKDQPNQTPPPAKTGKPTDKGDQGKGDSKAGKKGKKKDKDDPGAGQKVKGITWKDIEGQAAQHKDKGSKLKTWLDGQEKVPLSSIMKLPDLIPHQHYLVGETEVTEAAKSLGALRHAVFSDQLKRARAGYSGNRINKRKLPHIAAGIALDVFKSKTPRRQVNTHVQLLVDVSTSMRPSIHQANLVLLGMRQILCDVPKLRVDALAFSSSREGAFVVQHNGPFNAGFHTSGGTPLGEALNWTLYKAIASPQKRKIVFAITDGAPDDQVMVKDTLAAMKELGIQTIAILMGSQHQCHFETAVRIANVSELPGCLKEIWTELLYPRS